MDANPLRELIFRIDPKKARPGDETRTKDVVVDVDQGTVLPKRPLFAFGRDIRTYRIRNLTHSVEAEGPGYEILGPSFEERVQLRIQYRARCRPGCEEQVAVALSGEDNPGVALETVLIAALDGQIEERGRRGEDCYADFYRLQRSLEEQLESTIGQQTGLLLKIQLAPQGDQRPTAVEIQIPALQITTRDSDQVATLQLEARLEVVDTSTALRFQNTQLENWFGDGARSWIRENVTVHELYFELRTSLRERLQESLDRQAASVGRRVVHLALSRVGGLAESQLPPQSLRFEHRVSCDIRESSEQIVVRHVLQLRLEALGRYLTSGVGDLETWLATELDRATRELFFEMNYRTLLERFAPGVSETEDRLRGVLLERARAIGYGLYQMTAVPDLVPLEWRQGISLDRLMPDLATENPRVSVNLELACGGRIENPFDPRLAGFLEPQKARDFVPVVLAERLQQEVQKHLHGMDPERVYMRFQQTQVAGEVATKAFLESAVRRVLEEEFAVTEVYVAVKPAASQITDRLERLMSRTHSLSLRVVPFRGRGVGEAVDLKINFDILGVHAQGWHAFLAKRYAGADEELEAIRKILGDDIQATLSTVPSEVLQFADRSHQNLLQQVLSNCVQTVINTFGVVVQFISLGRDQTTIEQAQQAQLVGSVTHEAQAALLADKTLKDSQAEEMKLLVDQKNRLLIEDPDDDEIEVLEERIEALRDRMLPYPERQDHLGHLKPAAESEFDLDGYRRQLSNPDKARGALGPAPDVDEEGNHG